MVVVDVVVVDVVVVDVVVVVVAAVVEDPVSGKITGKVVVVVETSRFGIVLGVTGDEKLLVVGNALLEAI